MTDAAFKSAELIKNAFPGFSPRWAVVLGSGLGQLADRITHPKHVDYEDLPGFHKPAVEGHAGQFVLGELEGVPIMCLQGRAHLYEGISPSVIQTIVRTCYLMGCRSWLATNASGAIDETLRPGNLVLIRDHINFQFNNVLVGMNDERFGSRFVGMDEAYDKIYRKKMLAISEKNNIFLREGIYMGVLGPSFETPAEINAFRLMGATVIGMSNVPEIIVARHCGMRTLSLAVVTNMAAGLHPGVISHDDTLRGAALGAENMVQLVRAFLRAERHA